MSVISITSVVYPVYVKDTPMQQELLQRPEWHGKLSKVEAEDCLRGKLPNTYLLREDVDSVQLYLSFVRFDGAVDHLHFTMDQEKKRWLYRNGGPHQLISVEETISVMMHCPAHTCIPLNYQP